MDKYLTIKVTPGRMLLLAENAAVLLLSVLLACWGAFAVVGLIIDGFVPTVHTLMLLIALPFVLLLCWVLKRKRMRKQARAIISALLVSGKPVISCGELEAITGVRQCAEVIAKLTAEQYIRNVAVLCGEVRLADQAAPKAVCAYCGALMIFRKEGVDKCPSCGSAAVKYL